MAEQAPNTAVAVTKSITDNVVNRINSFVETGAIKLPDGYSHENAIRAAFLILTDMKKDNKPVLEHCTQPSIANAILRMTIQGLNPYKRHGSFIVYGDKLQWQEEYAGNKVLAKRYAGVVDVSHSTVYEGDEFVYEIVKGKKQIVKHVQDLKNIDMNKIVCAYAIATFEDGSTQAEIMSIQQIKTAWQMGAAKGQSKAHTEFTDRMAEKTVSNRLCRQLVNASDDGSVFDTDNSDHDEQTEQTKLAPKKEVQKVSFDDEAVIVSEEKPEPTKKEESKTETKPEPSF